MSVAKRAGIAFAVLFLVAMSASGTVFGLARSSSARLTDFTQHAQALDTAMWGLRADFYNYDDQMNMYVAVLAGSTVTDDLAEVTFQQAVQARRAMGSELDRATKLTTDRSVLAHLARLRGDYEAYNGFADQTRAAAQAGDVAKAVFLSTRGNLKPSNDIMPTLDAAAKTVDRLVARQLTGVQDAQRTAQTVSIASATLIAILIIMVAVGTGRYVLRPLTLLRAAMQAIATGSTSRESRAPAGGNDEIAHVGRAFNTMLDALADQDSALAAAATERERQLATSFDQQKDAEQQVRTRAQSVIDATAESVSADLTGIGSQVEVVRQAAQTIDDRVGAADVVTRTVVEQARAADQVVGALQASLNEVRGMAELIAGVADQTKLLALNATIEAARAGEAGRGFSVVADEVKDLAMTTAQSTGQITTTIATLEQHSQAVAAAIASIGTGILEVDEATAVLRDVARQQFTVVATLEDQVGLAVEWVASMSDLADRLERRAHDRAPATGRVVVTVDGRTLVGALVDVAEGGLRATVDGAAALRVGQEGLVQFTINGRALDLHGRVAVRRVEAADNELGMELLDLSSADQRAIREFVQG
jgi:methyl-accepting chemotaxis protein